MQLWGSPQVAESSYVCQKNFRGTRVVRHLFVFLYFSLCCVVVKFSCYVKPEIAVSKVGPVIIIDALAGAMPSKMCSCKFQLWEKYYLMQVHLPNVLGFVSVCSWSFHRLSKCIYFSNCRSVLGFNIRISSA